MPESTVLILGCGIGGVAAAKEIKRLMRSECRVVVIDRDPVATFPPSYLWVMTGDRRRETISRQRAQLARHGVEFVNAEVREIDLENRQVRANSREIRFDFLILALGADTTLDQKPGLAEAAQNFFTLDGAERLAASLRYFSGGRVVISVAGIPFKCPAAPYEAAMLIEHHFHSRRMRQKVEIEIHTPEERPMAVAGSTVGDEISGLLAHKGIELHTGRELLGADSRGRLVSFADTDPVPFDLLIAVPEHQAPDVIRETDLLDSTGWVPVDAGTLGTRHENVFAIGDITSITLPDGLKLPKAGVFAEAQARSAAKQIAFRIRGGPVPEPYAGEGKCFLEVGAGAVALAQGNFLATERKIELKQPSIMWHWAKVAFEKQWLWRTY